MQDLIVSKSGTVVYSGVTCYFLLALFFVIVIFTCIICMSQKWEKSSVTNGVFIFSICAILCSVVGSAILLVNPIGYKYKLKMKIDDSLLISSYQEYGKIVSITDDEKYFIVENYYRFDENFDGEEK